MRRDLTTSVLATIVLTVVLGLAYPLATTGIAQVLFGHQADGSLIERDGETVGSELIGQGFKADGAPDPLYFQSRPSVTGYSGDVTFFNNLGPNNKELSQLFRALAERYLALEGPHTPGLTVADIPVDAVTTSASGVDPLISVANARIQANRVASERGLDLARVNELIDDHTDHRDLGLLGEAGVNVLELNLALDEEEAA